jgi:hypothetical protein
MARTAYNDSQAESIYQHGAGNSKRMPDALRDLPYGVGAKSGQKPSSGHDQKMTKKGTAGKK